LGTANISASEAVSDALESFYFDLLDLNSTSGLNDMFMVLGDGNILFLSVSGLVVILFGSGSQTMLVCF
jgi:hypothetical protein